MHTLYARREPTTDWTVLKYDRKNQSEYRDVVIYNDTKCSELVCRYRWDIKSKPDKRNKYVTINCYKYKLEWLTGV